MSVWKLPDRNRIIRIMDDLSGKELSINGSPPELPALGILVPSDFFKNTSAYSDTADGINEFAGRQVYSRKILVCIGYLQAGLSKTILID